MLQDGRSRVRSRWCHWNFSLTKFFRSHRESVSLSTRKYTFAQRRNRLKTHYSGCIPVVKRRLSVMYLFLYDEVLLKSPSNPNWRTTPFWLSETIYSIHSQLPTISAVRLRHPQPKKATRHAEEDRLVEECGRILHKQSAFFSSDFNQKRKALTNFCTTRKVK